MDNDTIDTTQSDASVGIVMRTNGQVVFIKRALESIIHQSYADWHLVIVNDGGDAAPIDRLVAHYAPQLGNRYKVIHNPTSLGMEAVSNQAIQSIKTRYLAIHDDNDSWSPEFLTITVAELEQVRHQFPQVAGVITLANRISERVEGNIVHIDRTEPYFTSEKRGFVSLSELLSENQFTPIQFLFHYKAAASIHFFRTDLPVLGDWDFNIRFLCRYDIYIIPQFLAFYHQRIAHHGDSNSIHTTQNQEALYTNLLKNEWLRQDINQRQLGIGMLIALQRTLSPMEKTHALLHETAHIKSQSAPSPRLQNIRRLASLWITSGQKLTTVKKFFHILLSEGIISAVRQTKAWYHFHKKQ